MNRVLLATLFLLPSCSIVGKDVGVYPGFAPNRDVIQIGDTTELNLHLQAAEYGLFLGFKSGRLMSIPVRMCPTQTPEVNAMLQSLLIPQVTSIKEVDSVEGTKVIDKLSVGDKESP